MSNCQKYCLSCKSEQEFKVNFLNTHGICSVHLAYNTEFLKCIHCACTIPFTLITQINALPDSTPPALIENKKCDYCLKTARLSSSPCHQICKDCYEDKCPLCNSVEVIPTYCEHCKSPCTPESLSCRHQICSNCYKSGCSLCSLINRPDSLYTVTQSNCEYCENEVYSIICTSSHRICNSCYKDSCPLCNRLSLRPTVCEACKKNKIQVNCSKGHSLCDECALECVLCQSDLFSVLDPKDEGQAGLTIDSKKNANVEDRSGTEKKVQNINKTKVECETGQSEPKVGQGTTSHYNPIPVENSSTKKFNNQGSNTCGKCALF